MEGSAKDPDDMHEYVEGCVKEGYLPSYVSLIILSFYERFRERYEGIPMDAAPSGSESFLLALDNGNHYIEFEFLWSKAIVDGKWEFFYRNRETDEMVGMEFKKVNFDAVDKYIQRTRP